MLRKGLVLIIVYVFGLGANAQELNLKIVCHDKGNRDLRKLMNQKSVFKDSVELQKYLFQTKLELIEQSFLACSFDSIRSVENEVKAFLTLGRSYNWVTLGMGNVDEEILSKTGYRDKFFTGSKFSYKQLSRLFERIITLYENTGFPFAVVELDSIKVDNDKISASLKLNRNKLVRIDSVKIYSESKISKNYIYNYIGVAPGDLYQEKYIQKIDNRLNELSFIRESRDHDVAFTASNTILNLYLEKANANRFDGIIGVLPNEDNGKVEFTGDVKLRLLNSFNRGELINFNWRRLVNKSQDLKFKFNYPYLFNTPFGVDFDLKLYRRDTTFIDIYLKYGLQYMWKANNYIEVFIHDKNSNLLSTAQYLNTTVLPPFADVNSTLYGIGVNVENLDYRLNPRKGYAFGIQAEVGRKNIRKISDLNQEVYEGLQLKSNLYNLSAHLQYFIPVSRIMTVMLGNQSAYTFNENIFENELYRIGGLLVLRGFDEESIFASAYAVNTFEYRILLEKNSYWYLFMDAAYYENNNVASDTFISDTPFGFGTGISFQTNAGIFSINYALGKQFNNPIVFRAAKIHFGFVNYF